MFYFMLIVYINISTLQAHVELMSTCVEESVTAGQRSLHSLLSVVHSLLQEFPRSEPSIQRIEELKQEYRQHMQKLLHSVATLTEIQGTSGSDGMPCTATEDDGSLIARKAELVQAWMLAYFMPTRY